MSGIAVHHLLSILEKEKNTFLDHILEVSQWVGTFICFGTEVAA
jgi:hypothetical protein